MTHRIRATLTVLATMAAFAVSARADEPVAAKKPVSPKPQLSAKDAEHLLYLSSERLVVLRLHIRVNGKNYATVWRELIDKYFDDLDTNKDGLLNAKEQQAIPSLSDLQRSGILASVQRTGVSLTPRGVRLPTVSRNTVDTTPKDGKVTRKELRKYLLRAGVKPFSVQANGNSRTQTVTSFGRGNPNVAGKKLFELLDTNDDGKLSKPELLAANKSLHKADLDDDELISTAELSGPSSPFVYRVSGSMNRVYNGSAFLSLSSGQSATQLVRQLIRRYDKPQTDGTAPDSKLSAKELGLDAKSLAAFDADKDGALDFTELRQFLRKPVPGMEIIVRLGKRKSGEKLIEVVNVDPTLKKHLKKVTGQLAHIGLQNARIDFVAADGNRYANSWTSYDRQFKSADRNNNGYLEKSEARVYGAFSRVFEMMDADKDGKVFKKEMRAFFRRQLSLAQSRTVLNISDQGRDLFKILDLDGDQRLSRRELEAAVARIETWDDNDDRQIAKAEVPRQYRLSVARGRPGNPYGSVFAVSAFPGGSRRNRRGNAPGPKWFSRMDVNGDGEVSRREFLAKPSLFAKLDTNRNGRLELTEAEKAGVRSQKK